MIAIYLTLGVFLVGFVLALLLNRLKLGDSSTFIALLLTPLLVYAVASGKVQEFTAPGGWGAKFREAAQATVAPAVALTPVNDVQKLDLVEKGGVGALASLHVERGKPIALSFQLGQRNYSIDAATKYVETLLLTDNEMTTLILDADHRFVAMTEGTTFLALLKTPMEGQMVLAALANNNRNYFVNLPAFHTNSIKATDSNVTALEKMRQQNARAIVVVDNDNRPTGVVKRDDIVARLLENLAMPDKAS